MVLHCEKVCLKMALVHGFNIDNSAIVAIAFLLLRVDSFQSDEWKMELLMPGIIN